MAQHGIDIGDWVITIILSVVLLAVLVGTYPSLASNASGFGNVTGHNAMADMIGTLLPVLISAGVLLLFVFAYLPRKYGHHGK